MIAREPPRRVFLKQSVPIVPTDEAAGADVPNLFMIDGRNLVTRGRNHQTMTIQALAYRAAEHVVRAARSGALRSSV